MKFYVGTLKRDQPLDKPVDTDFCVIFTPDKDNYLVWGILSAVEIDVETRDSFVHICETAASVGGFAYIRKTTTGWDYGWLDDNKTTEPWSLALENAE